MKLLVDTHIWIWNLAGSKRIPVAFRKAIASDKTEAWLSPISVWETLVLAEKGRIRLKPDPISWGDHGISPERMRQDAAQTGFEVVRIDDFLPEDLIFILKIRN